MQATESPPDRTVIRAAIKVTPSNPIKDQQVTVTVKLHNYENSPIYFSHLGIANRLLSPYTNYDFGWLSNSSIAANSDQELSFTRSFNNVSNYYAWTSIHIGNSFYSLKNVYGNDIAVGYKVK